ncbi:hypothetical protein RvY_03651-2 [Ramazzottius varieornatus]|uniref:G-protein coupled receptors family 1 profile domain-containing protein n=1 Tax=Ramazzottius varieornatus TaxID=947166 RepID=A0A1D1US70_RAMVA|nr:hypothetical protein RvY_03651-2 [Ramazzottius varieornatus]
MAVQAFVGHWPFNEHACSFAVFLLYAGGVKSLHCELLIALNRFWAVSAPHQYRIHHTKRLAGYLCAVVWFLGSLLVL